METVVGKTALVTGAAAGIGRATALRCAAEGAQVSVSDIAEKDGEQTPDEVAELIVWLCSDKASFMTGARGPVDGGFVAQ